MHISIPIENTAQFIEATQLSPLVSKCEIKVLYVSDQPNRNGSIITREVAEDIGSKLPGSPIVGYYNAETKDFEGHNRDLKFDNKDQTFYFVDTTKPYGFVPTDAKVWFQDFQDEGGIIRTYLCTEGVIWTEAYPEAQHILDNGNNQSMEFQKSSLEGHWAEQENSAQRFFIINEAIIEKLCILGEEYEPCFEGAQIKSQFSLADEIEQLRQSMYSLVQKMSTEGGLKSPMDDNMKETELELEQPVPAEYEQKKEEEKNPPEKKDENASQGKSDEENTSESKEDTEGSKEEPKKDDEDEGKKKYSLEEIPEYVELQQNYSALQEQYAALEQQLADLNAEVEPLRTFKLESERKEKQAMIDSFYMLSAEDKQDVIANIDTYSLDDIESKLAVICLHNKVSFAEPDAQENSAQLTFSLNNAAESDVPEWVRAVRETEKKMN